MSGIITDGNERVARLFGSLERMLSGRQKMHSYYYLGC